MRYDRASGASSEIIRGFDLQVDEFVFSPDGNTIYFVAGERGRSPIYKVAATGGTATKVVDHVFASSLNITSDGRSLVFAHSSIAAPPSVYRRTSTAAASRIDDIQSRSKSRANLPEAEEMSGLARWDRRFTASW